MRNPEPIRWLVIPIAAMLLVTPTFSRAAALKPGDIVTFYYGFDDGATGTVRLIDGVTHDRSYLSTPLLGVGPNIFGLWINVDSDGSLLTVGFQFNQANGQILKIDPTTGDRVPLYDTTNGQPPTGSGPGLSSPIGFLLEPNGRLIVADENAVLEFDPATGNRTIISDATHGVGPWSAGYHTGITYDSAGNLILNSYFDGVIYHIDRLTGDRQILSGSATGAGPAMSQLIGLAVESDGNLIVASKGALLRVNPTTGDRTVMSSATVGTGAFMGDPGGLALDAEGNIVFTDGYAIQRVDPITGNRTFLASNVQDLVGLAIVPATVPEPSTLALAGIGGVALLAYAKRRRSI